MIIFGLHLDDLQFYKLNQLGQKLYTSDFLFNCWQKQGIVVVAPATWDTCAYVARYMMKKQKGETADIYQRYNFEPEFSLMSRKPGLGRQYWDDKQSSMFDTDCIFISTPDGSKKFYPSRYYKKLFAAYDEEAYLDYQYRKECANQDIQRIKLTNTSADYLAMLKSEERMKRAKMQALRRNLK